MYNEERNWILVVEDEKRISELIRRALVEEGFLVQVSKDSLEARLKLSNQKYACIVLDLHLAKGRGTDVINEVKRNKENSNRFTPIVVVSGFLDKDVMIELRKLVQGAIVKPFKPSQLVEAVKSAVQEGKKFDAELSKSREKK